MRGGVCWLDGWDLGFWMLVVDLCFLKFKFLRWEFIEFIWKKRGGKWKRGVGRGGGGR